MDPSGKWAPRSDLASVAQTTIVCHLVNAALESGEAVRWDKTEMELVGKHGKDTLAYSRPYRKPWKLPIYSWRDAPTLAQAAMVEPGHAAGAVVEP